MILSVAVIGPAPASGVPHDANACEHRGASQRGDQDQRLHCSLPLRGLVNGLRKLRDVGAGILERDERAAPRQRYRIVKWSLPWGDFIGRASRAVLDASFSASETPTTGQLLSQQTRARPGDRAPP